MIQEMEDKLSAHKGSVEKLQVELALCAPKENVEDLQRQLAAWQSTHKEHVDNLQRELSVKHQEDVDKLRGELVYLRRELSMKHQEDVDKLRGELVGTQLSAKTESIET